MTNFDDADRALIPAWYGLGVIALASAFAGVNVQVLILLTEPLKRSLHLSDTDVGSLSGVALSLTGMLATYPMGMLADRLDRRLLMGVCVLFWSLATAFVGLAHNFPEVFLCGMGIALGEAVLGPISYSMIADLFPRRHWMVANYVMYIAGVLGGAAGMALSGLAISFVEARHATFPAMLASFEPWRLTMFLVSVPGPLVALAIFLIRRTKSVHAAQVEVKAPIWRYIRDHARTLIGVFAGFGLAAAAHRNLGMWVTISLVRVFHEPAGQVGVKLGILSGTFSLAGVFLSGFLVRSFRPRFGERAPLIVAQGAIAMGAVIMPAYLFATAAWQVYAISFVSGVAMITAICLSPSFLQRIAPNLFRSRVIALGGLFFILLVSATPIAVGRLSDSVFTGPRKLLASMVCVSLPCALASVAFLWLLHLSLAKTLAASEEADLESSPLAVVAAH